MNPSSRVFGSPHLHGSWKASLLLSLSLGMAACSESGDDRANVGSQGQAGSAGESNSPSGTGGGSNPNGTGGGAASGGTGTLCSMGASSGENTDPGPAPSFDETADPELRVDLDVSGRPSTEVTEIGYQAWPVENGTSLEKTFEGVTFRFEKAGSAGSELTGGWSKGVVQHPNYSRLAGDGLTVDDGDAGAEIKLTISDLPAGAHSLLVYLSDVAKPDNNTFAPVDILLNGSPAVAGIQPTTRAYTSYDAAQAYLTFEVSAGEDVVITFRADKSSKASKKNVFINGFELDTPNAEKQAQRPSPVHGDEHVDADSGSVTLSWEAGDGAVTHDIYVGEDADEVRNADRTSPTFLGNQSTTELTIGCLSTRKTYYWRVDQIDAEDHGTRGDVWYFRPRQLAFPSAEGYGRFARGGRDGVVVHVTNLNDSGPGSLREAVENDIGPRTIVFDVAGIIALKSRLVLNSRYVTVAGQTAPGKGIVVRAAPFGMSGAQDSVIRHLRVRLGAGTTYDGMGMTGSDHSIIDHCSISWTIDEAFSSRGAKNITLQRTLISEALNVAGHQNYPAGTAHGYAGTISGNFGSFHHNLLAHNEGRNFSMGSALDGFDEFASQLDLFNNVVYNFGGRATDGQAHKVNFVNNYYKKGPATRLDQTFSMDFENYGTGTLEAYYSGNILQNANGSFKCDGTDDSCGRRYTLSNGNPAPTWEVFPDDGPLFPSYATIQSARDAYKSVLSDVGCTSPILDDHDVRVVRETLEGKATYEGSKSGDPGLPDHQDDVGGYESYPETHREDDWDSDGDGLPNFWETARGLDVASPGGDFSDAHGDTDGDGFTELDDYLEWMSNPHYVTDQGSTVTVDLEKMFVGYTESPSYSVSGPNADAVVMSGDSAVVSADSCGLSTFVVTVKDAKEAEMSKTVGLFVACGS